MKTLTKGGINLKKFLMDGGFFLVLLLALVGCGEKEANIGESKEDPFVIGIVSISTQDWLNTAVIKGVEAVADENGWEVEVVNANGNVQEANSAIQNFASKKVDGIIDLVFPATNLKAGLNTAKEAGIPVLTWGGGLADGVAATNGAGGPFAVPAVEEMVKAMDGEGSILALTYHTGLVAREREEELDKILENYPNIEVTKEEVSIPGDLQSGQKYAAAWLASHPEGSGNLAIWGAWDNPTLGAAIEIKRQKRTDVKVYGQNGQPSVLEAIEAGHFTGVVWENGVAEGKQLAELLPEIIEAGEEWEPKVYAVPGVYIDKTNVQEFMDTHPDGYEQ